MRKITLVIVLLLSVNLNYSQQTYTTLKLPNVEVSSPGEFALPLELTYCSPGDLIVGIQISFYFDPTYVTWMGTSTTPGNGISFINPALTPLGGDWLWNYSNPGNLIFLWIDPTFNGVLITSPSNLLVFRFNYLGGLPPGGSSTPLTFSLTLQMQNNSKEAKIVNELTNQYFEAYTLTLINGTVSALIAPTVTLNAKMFLEGPYFNSQMTPFLNILGYIPLDQPYNTEPWNYNGPETVTAIPNTNVVDWVLVELLKRHQGNEEYLFEVKARKAAFLLKNGDIKDLNGTSGLSFNDFDEPEFYLRIYHRNHLPLISTAPLTGTNGIYNYDFTTGPSKAIGGASVQKQLKLDLWGAMTGDGNASKQIDNKDKNDLWLIENNLTGYYSGDYNMDSQVDDDDKAIKWKSNAGRGLPAVRDSIPPPAPWACGDPIVDLRDSQSYNTVAIGTQCWMAENLNIGTRLDGIGEQTDNAILEKYCYDNNEANCDTYGGLYQWNEMMQYTTQQGMQGICPDGWHIPTDGEWCTLTQFVDLTVNCNIIDWSGINVGTKLKSTSGWNSGGNGTNTSGFTALPGGYLDDNNNFVYLTINAPFWSSTVVSTLHAWDRNLSYSSGSIHRNYISKPYGFSVRCVHGEYINQPPSIPSSPQPADSAVNQPTNSALSWTCTDPDNDPLTYDVYFSTVNPPSLVSSGQTEITYIPGQLAESTSYFWKIVAHDNQGFTTEGPVWTFATRAWQCADPLIDARDMQTYPTVQIGTQCWMAENLNIGNMVQGNVNMTNNSIIEKYCYSNSAANCDVYGGLYQWNEMMQYITLQGTQGICPAGWHLPKDVEWTTLTDYLGGASVAGGKLKETGNTHWLSPNGGATNESGFTALPGGYRYSGGIFLDMGSTGNWWTSTELAPDARYRSMTNLNGMVNSDVYYKSSGFSVRCVLGEYVNQPPSVPSNPQPVNGAIDQPVNSTLSWACTDVENDPLTFDVYFGNTNPPSLVSSGQTTTDYNPGFLDNSTTYYWKIVAHDNQTNTTEGPVWNFATIAWLCNETIVDTRDGQTYNTVQIGEQCWMAENLNIGTRIDGVNDQTDNTIIEKHCYSDIEDSCNVYGGLYQWDEMMEYMIIEGTQGICPLGWRVPTDAEYTTLTDYLAGESVAGGKMKTTGTIEEGTGLWYAPNTGATNESAFTAFPGGRKRPYFIFNNFQNLGYYGYYWTSSQSDAFFAWFRRLGFNDTNILRYDEEKPYSFSVRCIKDTPPPTWSCGDPINDTRDGQTYNTVQIGEQCWMAENLNVGTMINGSINQTQQTPEVIEKYCYDNNTANCDTYGGLYQWNEMMQYSTTPGVQGICPVGWHVPTDGEWCTLTQFIDPTVSCGVSWEPVGTDIGIKLKSTEGWSNGGNGTNTSGFTAIPAGYLWGNFNELSSFTIFWTSTISNYIYFWGLDPSNQITRYDWDINDLISDSVRCLKD